MKLTVGGDAKTYYLPIKYQKYYFSRKRFKNIILHGQGEARAPAPSSLRAWL